MSIYIYMYISDWYARARFLIVGLQITNYIIDILWFVIHFSIASYLRLVCSQCSNKKIYSSVNSNHDLLSLVNTCSNLEFCICHIPYSEPVYTGWSIVHWHVTGMPLVDSSVHRDTNGLPSKYLQGTLENHWKNVVETIPHWNAIGETLTTIAYTGTPLEGL